MTRFPLRIVMTPAVALVGKKLATQEAPSKRSQVAGAFQLPLAALRKSPADCAVAEKVKPAAASSHRKKRRDFLIANRLFLEWSLNG